MFPKSDRRSFLGAAVAAASATLLPAKVLAANENAHSAQARVKELGLSLPEAATPAATYVTAVISGSMLYISGHGPAKLDGVKAGKVGVDLTIEEAQFAARATAINVLATMQSKLGSLDRVVQLVRTFGMVNAPADFTQQPSVINGYSDLMAEVFGAEAGKGVRAAVGMGSLPSNIAVEIESIWEIRA